jgi:hypothetical protein
VTGQALWVIDSMLVIHSFAGIIFLNAQFQPSKARHVHLGSQPEQFSWNTFFNSPKIYNLASE